MHHDWLFNFRVLQLRLYSTEPITQLAEFIINVIKLYGMPIRLRTSHILSRRKKKPYHENRKLRGNSLSSATKFSTFFTRSDTEDTILCSCWFPSAKRSCKTERTCFSFRSKNRRMFRSRTDFHLREGGKNVQYGRTRFRRYSAT